MNHTHHQIPPPHRPETDPYAQVWVAMAVIVAIMAVQQLPLLSLRGVWWADEARHAAVLDEVLQHGHWLALHLNGSFYPDKPPVWFWLLAGIAQLTGWGASKVLFAALALSMLAYALALWQMARRVTGSAAVALAGTAITVSGLYVVLASHYARMDFLFAAMIFLSWAALFRAAGPSIDRRATLAGFALAGVACLIKGPFGLALPLVAFVLHLLWHRRAARLADRAVLGGLAIVAAMVALWALGLLATVGTREITGLVQSQIVERASHGGASGRHPLLYLLMAPLLLLPWSAVLLAPTAPDSAPDTGTDSARMAQEGWRFLAFACVGGLVVLSAVGEKHEYYMIPLLGPLSVLIAGSLLSMSPRHRARVALGLAVALALTGLALSTVAMSPDLIPGLIGGAGQFAPALSALMVPGLVLVAGGILVAALRRAGPALLIGLVLGVQTLFAGLALAMVVPRIDAALNPESVAAAMRPLVAAGHAPGVVHGIDGVFAHALGGRYAHLASADALARWLEAAPDAIVLAIESPAAHWLVPPGGRDFGQVACVPLIGLDFIILASPPPLGSAEWAPDAACR